MSRSNANPNPLPVADESFVDPADLKFDGQNPRFAGQSFPDEDALIKFLYESYDVDELIQSMLSGGYVDFEPLIVQKTSQIVFEGNRRLAALRLISDGALRNRLAVSLPTIENPHVSPTAVRVRWVDDRTAARTFIGFKHINGPFKWDSIAKAQYAASWLAEGGDIGRISKTLGDSHSTVRRMVGGWYALQQAEANGFERDKVTKKTFSFSHLYTVLGRPAVREFLGMREEDASGSPKANPVPNSHLHQLGLLMSWLYGQEQKGEHTLVLSQNPNLNQLSRVLGNTEARLVLVNTRNLRLAVEKLDPPSQRFEASLIRTNQLAEETLSLVGSYEGDATQLRMAEGLQKTSRSLLSAMRNVAAGEDDVERGR